MVPVTPTFPVLKLPLLARENVIRRMTCLDRMSFSLCSKRSKRFLKSLRISIQEVQIQISNAITLSIPKMDEEEYKFTFDNPAECLESSFTVTGSMLHVWEDEDGDWHEGENEKSTFNIPNFSVREWVAHILDIIDSPSLSLEFHEDCDLFSVRDINQLIGNLERAELTIYEQSTPNEYLLEVLETFRPTKYLCLSENPFPNALTFRKYLRHSIDAVILRKNLKININEIYSMNCISASIHNPQISTSTLNTMLKVWTEGWTPRMKLISLHYSLRRLGENYMEEILDGLEYLKIEEERTLKEPLSDASRTFEKSYDIVRKDGQRATVYPRIYSDGDGMGMEVYITDE
ncbi:hypothetical protein CAEBREN_07193 [Caenorhabditis brenneri]|uniref:Uncharacterized protein n=1 Tax=Caenorhabditis brenneri TaxID=135651 RepID=G0N664_CAEBE|nr:hypothetical protein CAEBREN_07193 [Caenorhabditis brenneri]